MEQWIQLRSRESVVLLMLACVQLACTFVVLYSQAPEWFHPSRGSAIHELVTGQRSDNR